MEASLIRNGGCACGAVRYEVSGRRLNIGECHCRMCQRSVGAASVTWASLRRERLRFVQGEPTWWASSVAAERGFCATCGTSLVFRPRGDHPFLDLTVASFDEPNSLAPSYHIWTASRLPWVHLDPALPAYAGSGPDWSPSPPAPRAGEEGEIRVVEGGPVDVIQLGDLFAAVGFSRSGDPGGLAAMLAGSRWTVTATRGEELVGFCRAVSDGISNGYVTSVAVRPDLQRQGIGRRMLQRLVGGRDQVKFILHTSPAGRGLYASVGFQDGQDYMVRPRAGQTP